MSETGNPGTTTRPARPMLWPALIVGLVAFATFLPGVGGRFVYDDHRFIEMNESIRTLENLPDFLLDPRTMTTEFWEGIFRPLRTTSFAVDHVFWELNPVGYHLQSLLWHAIASLCLLGLLVRLGVSRRPAAVAALIFAVHPAHAESVAWITSRGDVMSGALVILALYVHAGAREGVRWRGVGVAGLTFLALLAKELAIVALPLIVLLDLGMRRPWSHGGDRPRRHAVRAWLPVLGATVLYVALRQWRTNAYAVTDYFGHLPGWWGGTYLSQLCVAARGFFVHLTTALLPIGPRLDYYTPTDAVLDAGVVIAAIVLVVILVTAWRTWRTHAILAVGLLWFVGAMAPTSNVVFTVGIPSADRFLYLPLAGLALACVPLLKGRRLVCAGAIVLLFAAMGGQDSRRYMDNMSLWENPSPGSVRGQAHEANMKYGEIMRLWQAGRFDEGLERIPASMEEIRSLIGRWEEIMGPLSVPDVQAYARIANLYRLSGQRREAFEYLVKAEQGRRHASEMHNIRGLLFQDGGDFGAALGELKTARDRGFKDHPLEKDIGVVLTQIAGWERDQGGFGQAMRLLDESLDEWPAEEGNETAWPALRMFREEKRRLLASPEPAPDDVAGWFDRGRLLCQFGLVDRGWRILGGLRNRFPRNAQIAQAVARWYFEEWIGQEEARKAYMRAFALDSGNEQTRLGMVRTGAFQEEPELKDDPGRRLRLLEGLPDRPQVLILRALALEDLDRDDEARELLEQAAEGQGPGVSHALRLRWEREHEDE